MTMLMPYFMKNKEWYEKRINENDEVYYVPTDKATPKAIKSIEEYNWETSEEGQRALLEPFGFDPDEYQIDI